MKKILLLIFPSIISAQVGIGTANPTADLHIAGNTSTIRIESLNATNSPTYNNGIKPALAYVTASGDVTIDPSINNGVGPGGIISPVNFLLTNPDFISNGVANRGVIINNNTSVTNTIGQIAKIDFNSPTSALIEVKYSITALLSSTDLNAALTPFDDISTRVFKIYFCIDVNNDGLDASELSKKYGINGQAYSSNTLGIQGYAYTSGHGYTNIVPGNHSLIFFAEVIDGVSKYTSIGFGGQNDLLKIRIYN